MDELPSRKKNCIFCDQFFDCKDMQKHKSICSLAKKHELVVDESLPFLSQKEMIAMILDLKAKVELLSESNQQLQKEVSKLKKVSSLRVRKNVVEYLNQNLSPPKQPFKEWLRSLQVGENHLQVVMDHDVAHGIISCLDEWVDQEGMQNLPIRVFKDKPDCVFLFTENSEKKNVEWMCLSKHEILQITEYFTYEFIKLFYSWNDKMNRRTNRGDKRARGSRNEDADDRGESDDEDDNDEDEKEDTYNMMLKITHANTKNKQDKIKNEFFKWLLAKLSI